MNIRHAGGAGTDLSANEATVPIATYVLLATVPATPSRAAVEVQNQSATTVQVVKDDGADNELTTILLASGGAVNTQGGSWMSLTFKGRVRVYGPTGSQVSVSQE